MSPVPSRRLQLDVLEARHAPAVTIVNPTTATYTDVDGDRVTVRVSAGTLTPGTFLTTPTGAGEQLQLVDLRSPLFDRADVSITARRGPTGDGRVNVGHIDATTHDLGAVVVAGDLGQINAGDGLPLAPAVRSHGPFARPVRDRHPGGRRRRVQQPQRPPRVPLRPRGRGRGHRGRERWVRRHHRVGDHRRLPGGRPGPVRRLHRHQRRHGAGPDRWEHPGRDRGRVRDDRERRPPRRADRRRLDRWRGRLRQRPGRHQRRPGPGPGRARRPGRARGRVRADRGHRPAGEPDRRRVPGRRVGGRQRLRLQLPGCGAGADRSGRAGRDGRQHGPDREHHEPGRGDHRRRPGRGRAPHGGSIRSGGHLGSVRVGRDVLGGVGFWSGRISAGGRIAGVAIGGALVGGFNTDTGSVQSGSTLGPVTVRGDVQGGPGLFSGRIESGAKLVGVTVGGSLLGGPAAGSGVVNSLGDLGPVRVGGNIQGAAGSFSGRIESTLGRIASVTVGGSLLGGSNFEAGAIASGSDLGPVTIGHDVRGGSIGPGEPTLEGTGSIVSLGRIARVFVGGSIVSGTDMSAAGELKENATVRAGHDLGALVVRGSLVGNVTPFGDSPVLITARGQAAPGPTTDLAIGRVAVGGRVERTYFGAGYNTALDPVNADAQVGVVTVGGDWSASALLAGVREGPDMLFGTADDVRILGPGTTDNPSIVSRIGRVTIGGQALGTPGSVSAADHYGFVAQQVGALTVGGRAFPLAAGAANDLGGLAVGVSGDLRVREVGL